MTAGLRIWWNWQTRYFEVVVPQGVQVQVLLSAPLFLGKLRFGALRVNRAQFVRFHRQPWFTPPATGSLTCPAFRLTAESSAAAAATVPPETPVPPPDRQNRRSTTRIITPGVMECKAVESPPTPPTLLAAARIGRRRPKGGHRGLRSLVRLRKELPFHESVTSGSFVRMHAASDPTVRAHAAQRRTTDCHWIRPGFGSRRIRRGRTRKRSSTSISRPAASEAGVCIELGRVCPGIGRFAQPPLLTVLTRSFWEQRRAPGRGEQSDQDRIVSD